MNLASYIPNIQKIEEKNLFKIAGSDFEALQYFEAQYLDIRLKEERNFSDEEILALPICNKSKLLKAEWELRAKSYNQLDKFIQVNSSKNILDIGCGNGWLFNRIQNLIISYVGVEGNLSELTQANSLFDSEKAVWLYGDIYKMKTEKPLFDLIIFNASFQYFKTPKEILTYLLQNHLLSNGRIVIMDSPFYNSKTESDLAKLSSQNYFATVNQSAPDYYNHNTIDTLDTFKTKILNNKTWLRRIKKYFFNISYNPFPFIIISH
jgi:SAM-dependent methyltransferase